ncbi:hypothetical protein GE21DRAFT_2614 [Neurospora crassa]|uniref:DUF7918 domain-containing protein n=1 Tax=Neurospora crassa (strain ATCC 24698 / 74-OR23-1A / CBS 708.71 / DSM 1257 / FGSC 987) TaxID=367110 RepID=Q7SFJ1_NEUCR|nr:hypothetical protein NCU08630 [Neurospora crassa OR74A]EAA35602.1 hypothetical protein NCU08630 [Neurospora crassa OR74A]KHE81227.1 hypothetical protein GE21DRAFT_2614 [Neurospora crassa]|eukprot:XP_964838.1 hypothetical protein NCU08630 [Neurospora crassa OR74A]
MAILTCLPGLEVAVEVDGQRAREYEADPDEVESRAKEISYYSFQQTPDHKIPYVLKYIEAKAGKPFAFILDATNFHDFKKTEPKIYWCCSMDGFHSGYRRVSVGTENKRSCCKTGSQATGWKRHTFHFGSLDVREGGDGTQAEAAKHYGTLVVNLYLRVKTGGVIPFRDIDGPIPILSVGEKDLKGKAVDSKVSFESEPIDRPGQVATSRNVDPHHRPIAVFEFRYRTMEGLLQEGIVSRPVEKAEGVHVEEEYQVHPRVKPENEERRGVKKERPMDPTSSPLCYKLRRLENGKVEIDLTDN